MPGNGPSGTEHARLRTRPKREHQNLLRRDQEDRHRREQEDAPSRTGERGTSSYGDRSAGSAASSTDGCDNLIMPARVASGISTSARRRASHRRPRSTPLVRDPRSGCWIRHPELRLASERLHGGRISLADVSPSFHTDP